MGKRKKGRGKGEEEIRGGQKRRRKKRSVKEGKRKRVIGNLVGIEHKPELKVLLRKKKKSLHNIETGSTDTKG